MHPFLEMLDMIKKIAYLLAENGDTGYSPHVARCFFLMMFHDKILLYVYNI